MKKRIFYAACLFSALFFLVPASGAQEAAGPPAEEAGRLITGIHIEGLARLSRQTALSYMSLKEGQSVRRADLDKAVEALYKTNLFADVSLDMSEAGLLELRITENPSVNRIVFEGNSLIKKEDLLKAISVKPFEPYTRSRIQADARLIENIYQSQGKQGARVNPQVVFRKNNRVDVIYKITEGESAQILKISFIGSRHFRKSDLKSVIQTKESRFYRFFSSDDIYDPARVAVDERQLENFYRNKGFLDFSLSPTVVQQAPMYNGYYLSYVFSEGPLYHIGGITLDVAQSFFRPVKEAPLLAEIRRFFSIGDVANESLTEEMAQSLSFLLQDAGFSFVDVQTEMEKNPQDRTVVLHVRIRRAAALYVEKINIHGNVRTSDAFIRSHFLLREGSAFNRLFLNRTQESLQRTDLFQTVEMETAQGHSEDEVIVDVHVIEKDTGALNFGFTVSSLWGLGLKIGYRERNFLGQGKHLGIDLDKSQDSESYSISYYAPEFWNHYMDGGISLSYDRYKKGDYQSYDYKSYSLSPYVSFSLGQYLTQTLGVSFSKETIARLDTTASSPYLLEESGTKEARALYQTLSFDSTDDRFLPTRGFRWDIFLKYTGLGGDIHSFNSELSSSAYRAFDEDQRYTLFARASIGSVQPLGSDEVLPSYRLKMGYVDMKAFSYLGLGPYDPKKDYFLGGRHKLYTSAGLLTPFIFPKDYNLRFTLFYELGTLYGVSKRGRPNVIDDKFFRSNYGIGLSWLSPLGMMSLYVTTPLKRRPYDDTERIQFDIGGGF